MLTLFADDGSHRQCRDEEVDRLRLWLALPGTTTHKHIIPQSHIHNSQVTEDNATLPCDHVEIINAATADHSLSSVPEMRRGNLQVEATSIT